MFFIFRLVPDFSLSASNRWTLLQTGVLPQHLQSLDGIPQCLPYWLDGISVEMDTRPYEYFSLCYDCCNMGQNDTIGKIELNQSFALSSDNTNYRNDIQLFHQLFDELRVNSDYH